MDEAQHGTTDPGAADPRPVGEDLASAGDDLDPAPDGEGVSDPEGEDLTGGPLTGGGTTAGGVS